MSDWLLLKEYVDRKSETAFGRLVKQHINLVYRTCRRDIGNEQLAEDATQAVFLLLAQKAGSIRRDVSISGWLFNAARLVSRNTLRMESRRQKYEQEAAREMERLSTSAEAQDNIDPWLNDALSALSFADRDVILMRYFDGMSFQEIAEKTRSQQKTAAKRAERATEKMRRFLIGKGVVVSNADLCVVLVDQHADAVSESCQAATLQVIHRASIAHSVAIAHSQHSSLCRGVYLTMQATKYKYLIAAVVLLLFCSLSVHFALRERAAAATSSAAPVVTLSDSEAGPVIAADPTSAARPEIERDAIAEMTDRERGQWKQEPWDAPNRVIIEGDHSKQPADATFFAVMNRYASGMDKYVSNRTATIYVTAFQEVNGDVVMTTRFTERFVEKLQDPNVNDNAPVGTVITDGGAEQSQWHEINGRWIDVGPDSISATVH